MSYGRLLGWVKAWRGWRKPGHADDAERTGHVAIGRVPPQGAPIATLFSNVYMRRFILGWKVMGYARRFEAEIGNYADDCAPRRRGKEAEMAT